MLVRDEHGTDYYFMLSDCLNEDLARFVAFQRIYGREPRDHTEMCMRAVVLHRPEYRLVFVTEDGIKLSLQNGAWVVQYGYFYLAGADGLPILEDGKNTKLAGMVKLELVT